MHNTVFAFKGTPTSITREFTWMINNESFLREDAAQER